MNMMLTVQGRLKDLTVELRLILEQLAEDTGLFRAAWEKMRGDDLKDISQFSNVTLTKWRVFRFPDGSDIEKTVRIQLFLNCIQVMTSLKY